MPTLLNYRFPYLRIYDPQNDVMVAFRGGRLDIEPDDPSYGVVMAHASKDPSIQVISTVKEADRPTETTIVKQSSQLACDVCVPAVAFPNPEQYALHMKLVHAEGEEEEPIKPPRARR